MFSYIKQYFEMGLYTIDNLNTFVASDMMTKDQLSSLTAETDTATDPSVDSSVTNTNQASSAAE